MHKAYTFKEAGCKFAGLPGETYWMSYRHMLGQFVNGATGCETQVWVSGSDSIGQIKQLDMGCEKNGLGIRPTK